MFIFLLSFPPKRFNWGGGSNHQKHQCQGIVPRVPVFESTDCGLESLWEDGYFARTVGDRMTRDVIEKYIEHHRDLEQGPAQLNFKLR